MSADSFEKPFFHNGEVDQDYLWQGLAPCPTCGAPCYANQMGYQRVRGGMWNPEVPLNAYEAHNLLEALKLVPDTGDWHGQLRARCEAVIDKYPQEYGGPNQTAEQMRQTMERRS